MAGVQQMPNIPAPRKPRSLLSPPPPFLQGSRLSHVCSPWFSSPGHLAAPGFEPVTYRRCNKSPRESGLQDCPQTYPGNPCFSR